MEILRRIAYGLGLTNTAKFERLISEHRATAPEEYQFADEVLAAFHSGGGLAPKMQAYKLVSLGQLLEAKRPKSILELGSGSSSVVFARYAARNEARFVTVDESEEWLDNTLSMLGRFGFSGHASSHVCKKSINREDNTASYIDLPACEPDFVLIDGPALEANGTQYKDAVCVDVFGMIPGPSTIIVDVRKPTVEEMIRRIPPVSYQHTKSDILLKSPRKNFNYFSMFSKV